MEEQTGNEYNHTTDAFSDEPVEEFPQTINSFQQFESVQNSTKKTVKPMYNEEADLEEEKIQNVLDLNQSHEENVHTPKEDENSKSNYDFPFTPPPTPIIGFSDTTDESDSAGFLSRVQNTRQKSKGVSIANNDKLDKEKKVKLTGFKIESDISSDYDGAELDHDAKVKTTKGQKDIDQEKQQAECNRFAGVEKFANQFVDKVIEKSIDNIRANKSLYMHSPYTWLDEEDIATLSSIHTYVEIFGSLTRWPRIQEFTKELGEYTINEYMLTWEYHDDWLYCINFLIEQSDECSDYYLYEAIWSIPSKPYPIPQATASVYFTIEVSRVKPNYCPVDVSYVFEGSRLIHTPGKIPFQEHWLYSIIDAKLEVYRQIKF
ncbi:hypothetical protein ILUMI_06223 [Ignelater luminosus]|uniref:A-kinase anchor protein 14 n=1 Tax=Ignelater luminosus TaxID=2038154 RepID=A0A8K0GHY4_IGNLU|nr:hypothetical protein ILUMI_06223 [Ignelater luminosus]